jgi:small-conductance mechanosensitive channel
VLADPEPYVRLSGFGDSSVDMQLYCWTGDSGHRERYALQYALRKAVFAAFRREGIEIPFPQRDVHVHPDQAPAAP